MDVSLENPVQFISKAKDLYYKGIEVGMACATAFSVIGTSAGFILVWGPIIWGLLAAFIGFIFGFGIYLLAKKFTRYRQLPKRLPEVIVIVQCEQEQYKLVSETMWKYRALTVGQNQGTA